MPLCPMPMLTGNKRHYAAQKSITGQAKVKQTSGPQTVKTHIKSFFAFSHFIHVFAPPFRRFNFAFYTLSVFALSHFRTSHFIRAPHRITYDPIGPHQIMTNYHIGLWVLFPQWIPSRLHRPHRTMSDVKTNIPFQLLNLHIVHCTVPLQLLRAVIVSL